MSVPVMLLMLMSNIGTDILLVVRTATPCDGRSPTRGGRGLTRTPVAQLARTAEPWLIGSFIVLMLTGIPQMTSLATREYYSPYFWWKMQGILAGVVLTVTVRRRMSRRTEAELGPIWPKVVALVSLALWTSVTISGRLIGLLL